MTIAEMDLIKGLINSLGPEYRDEVYAVRVMLTEWNLMREAWGDGEFKI